MRVMTVTMTGCLLCCAVLADEVPEYFGVYAAYHGKLIELTNVQDNKRGQVAGGIDLLDSVSDISFPSGDLSFVVYEQAPRYTSIKVRRLARVANSISDNGRKPLTNRWYPTDNALQLRLAPVPANPDMMIRAVPPESLAPGYWVLDLDGRLYDFAVGEHAKEAADCLDRYIIWLQVDYRPCDTETTTAPVQDNRQEPVSNAAVLNAAIALPVPDGALGNFRHGTLVTKNAEGDLVVAEGAAEPLLTHVGVDIGAACGSPVVAAANGEVADRIDDDRDSDFPFLGYMVIVKHDAPVDVAEEFSIYLHLQRAPDVPVGTRVIRGVTQLGQVGATGATQGGCHTHFELRRFPSRFLEVPSWNQPWNIYGRGNQVTGPLFKNLWRDPEKAFDMTSSPGPDRAAAPEVAQTQFTIEARHLHSGLLKGGYCEGVLRFDPERLVFDSSVHPLELSCAAIQGITPGVEPMWMEANGQRKLGPVRTIAVMELLEASGKTKRWEFMPETTESFESVMARIPCQTR